MHILCGLCSLTVIQELHQCWTSFYVHHTLMLGFKAGFHCSAFGRKGTALLTLRHAQQENNEVRDDRELSYGS